MSNKELKKEYKKRDLEVVSLKNSIPLHISKKIIKKIGYLCTLIPKEEWSGVLFYSVKGSLAKFNEVELTVEDIYPMDKGSKAYTSYELDEDLIDYRMSNPESLKWKIGHIHSHNTMSTYFSGTDMSELNDNSEFHNYYLSLIVNNFMDMVAKVAFRGESKGFSCKNEEGKPWTLTLAEAREIMFTFDCDIKGEELIEVEENFTTRVTTIIEKAKKAEEKAKELPVRGFTTYPRQGNNSKDFENWNDSWKQKPRQQSLFDTFDSYLNEDKNLTEDFTRFLLRLGNEAVKGDTLEQVLEDISVSSVDYVLYANSIMEQYASLYEKYWEDFMARDIDSFVNNTKETIECMKEYEEYFTYLVPIIKNLEQMLSKLKIV
jgi:proteasome lid subunit RPN8/RPN11